MSLYGVSLAGVKGLLPWREITQDTKPSVTDVDDWLTADEAALSALVGTLVAVPDPEQRESLTVLAAQVVHHRVAARTEAAGLPEVANPNDASVYANWLSREADRLEGRLLTAVTTATGDTDPSSPEAVTTTGNFPDAHGWDVANRPNW